jgi:aminocarboxymuconate-semialdehyde decarboxylase
MSQFYLDTIVFATDQLEHLHQKFGPDHLLIGTDYAFDMGEYDPIEHVIQTSGMDDRAIAKICGGNAVRLFGLDPEMCGRADFTTGTPIV